MSGHRLHVTTGILLTLLASMALLIPTTPDGTSLPRPRPPCRLWRASQIQHPKFIFPTILLLSQRVPACKLPAWWEQHADILLAWVLCLSVPRGARRQPHRARLKKELNTSSLSHLCPCCFILLHMESTSLSSCSSSLAHCHLPGLLQWPSNWAPWSLLPTLHLFYDPGPTLLCSPAPLPTSMTSDCSYLLQGHGTGCSLCLKSSPHSHPMANSCSSWLLAQGTFASAPGLGEVP